MALIKGFWHFLVGVKDFLVLLLMVLIFAAILAARSGSGDAGPTIADGGALTIPLDGYLVTEAQELSPFQLLSGPAPIGEIETAELIGAIDAAREDGRVDIIVLDLDGFLGGGMADVQAVADALAAFRADGKRVATYASAYFDSAYLLAAHADEVWLNPLGAVVVAGPGGSQLYFAEALDKLKVDVNVFRVGTYKSAVEPYLLTEASQEAAAARQALLDDLWGIYLADAEAARPEAELPAYIAAMGDTVRAAGGDFAKAALAAGLVDHIGTRVAFGTAMAEAVGEGDDDIPGAYAGSNYADYVQASRSGFPARGDAVGIVRVAGGIVDGEAPAGVAASDTIAALIERAAADDDIKALVVRIDSPGGSVTASEDIRQALLTAKADGIPIVASFGPVAASGGYWVATAADTIVAQPSTITGSIGVFAVLPTFQNTLADLGISTDGAQTTPYSGAPDLLAGLTPATEEMLQLSVEDIYRRFVGIVADARKMPPERVDEIGQGRVWSGGAARQLGLVDRFGTLDDAIAVAEAAAGFDTGSLRRVTIKEPVPVALQILRDLMADSAGTPAGLRGGTAADQVAEQARRSLASQVANLVDLADGTAVQVRCLACTAISPEPSSRVSPSGLLAKLAAILD